MADYVLFLQNAWSPYYAGRTWPRESWLIALERCRSGQRLRFLLGDDYDRCENTTPIVGDSPSSVVPPDFDHIREVLTRRQPHVVVACGKQAADALLKVWTGPMLLIPHPAHRLVTNALYIYARDIIQLLDEQRAEQKIVQLVQEQGSFRAVNVTRTNAGERRRKRA